MVEALRPGRGGFLRPFGCGWFIREYLMGHGPEGSPKIDPDTGAPIVDIRYHYKEALYRAFAADAAAYEIERLIKAGKPPSEDKKEEIERYFYERIPYKITKCRHHSFHVYFGVLKRLGWVEFTGREEPSAIQENCPEPPAAPRRYYRLTKEGKRAADVFWSNPLRTLYQYPLEDLREKRKKHKYTRKGRR